MKKAKFCAVKKSMSLYASFSRISKAKSVNRTLLQTDNFFQFSDKKTTCLTRAQIKILGISEKHNYIGHFCQFSQVTRSTVDLLISDKNLVF